MKNPVFRKKFIEEKFKLDVEYSFEELKKAVIEKKSTRQILSNIEDIKKQLINSI
jgi:hypothetical protein